MYKSRRTPQDIEKGEEKENKAKKGEKVVDKREWI